MKLFAFDLDHTILNNNGEISPLDIATLKKIYNNGDLVVFASGRMTKSIRSFYKKLNFDSPVISYNGAKAIDKTEKNSAIIYDAPLDTQYANIVIDYATKNKILLNYYLNEKLYAIDTKDLRKYSDIYRNQTKSEYIFIPNYEQFRKDYPTKLLFITEPKRRNILFNEFKEKFGNTVNIFKTNPEYLEFMNIKADKSIALKVVAERYGIKNSDIFAFGDGENDLGMIEWAGTGIAVANACESIKSKANYVADVTNNQNPITTVIEKLNLL